MFHSLFFHHGFHSCHCHDALSDAMMLAAALKVEQDLQREWREEEQARKEKERTVECTNGERREK